MGHGPARELEGATGPLPELDEALAAKLSAALEKLDAKDPVYAEQREQERIGIMAKEWNGVCRDIDGHLRIVGKVLVASHQLNLDIGSDGGGLAQKPFMEDLRMKFPKLQFVLDVAKGRVYARCKDAEYGSAPLEGIDYDFCINAVCAWATAEATKLA
jgi:hypothetical protein